MLAVATLEQLLEHRTVHSRERESISFDLWKTYSTNLQPCSSKRKRGSAAPYLESTRTSDESSGSDIGPGETALVLLIPLLTAPLHDLHLQLQYGIFS
ncbi:hypothetical protein TREES_T100010504 [Tupaia chinensis]|uniref:Uncharacterized protein n=1 Tax=Tupaia chinensis TaxID=246437 RepID=L9LDX6_TUPCH|nr:hypothetical protein TREES_T100010504 [Tupaia chinensis]